MSEPLDTHAIAPLLRLAAPSQPADVALAALGAAASFRLAPQAWRDVAEALYAQIEALPRGSAARQQALRLAVRVPLRSWRTHLQGMADDPAEPDGDTLNLALVGVRDASRIRWVLARAAPEPEAAVHALACLPIEQQLSPSDLPLLPADAEPMAIFWGAMAKARLGDAAALDALLAGALGELPLFWGSPWIAYDEIARVRPLPPDLQDHLRSLQQRLATQPAPTESDAVRRMRALTVWAATGDRDAEGTLRSTVARAPELARPRYRIASAALQARAVQLQARTPGDWFDAESGPDADERDALAALPTGSSPALILTLLHAANQRAAALPQDAPAPMLLGNAVVDLVHACPIDGPEPVATYLQEHLAVTRPALDDSQLAWVLARDTPEHLIDSLAQLAQLLPTPQAQCRVLALLEGAAECQAGRATGPWLGAGPGGSAGDAQGMELIDDMPEQMAMAAPPEPAPVVEPPAPTPMPPPEPSAAPPTGRTARSAPAPAAARPPPAAAPPPPPPSPSPTMPSAAPPATRPPSAPSASGPPDAAKRRSAIIDKKFGAPASPRPPAAAPTPPPPAMRARASTTAQDVSDGAAPEPEERRVNATILHARKKRQSFVAGADNTIRCWIGLPEEGVASAAVAVPGVAIPAAGLPLQVHMCWRDSAGVEHQDSQSLLLPASRTASSSQCDLQLHVPDGERYVAADIAFLYRGRVFEAVRLEAFALSADQAESDRDQIRIQVQASHRQVIEIADSVPVDTVVMVPPPAAADAAPAAPSPSPSPSPGIRRFGGSGSQHFDLHQASGAIAWLNDTLHATQTLIVRKQAATKPAPGAQAVDADDFDDQDPDARGLLLDMARHGTGLFRELCDQGFGDPGERIQILCEDNDDHVPLEFVYDRGYPSANAQWCHSGLAALRQQAPTCPVCRFPGEESALGNVDVLCPYGFWSLRKVIERMSPTRDGAVSDPGGARRLLSPMTSVAFASSHLVPEAERQATLAALQQHFDTVLPADDWLQWRQVVQQNPALLMVLPHHGIASHLDYLEIGDQALDEALGKLSAAQIDEKVVNPDGHDPGPVVLLLGCQTARVSETGYGDLASRIHRQHASIVLGTLAQILGRHAGPIAREFALTLADLTGQDCDFGTVMLQVRRRMLSRGCLIAMCLVAQGDAQWRIQPRPQSTLPPPTAPTP